MSIHIRIPNLKTQMMPSMSSEVIRFFFEKVTFINYHNKYQIYLTEYEIRINFFMQQPTVQLPDPMQLVVGTF